MPDYNRIKDLGEMGDSNLEQAFIFFCRHLVSLSGSCQPIDVNGSPNGDEQHFTVSGFILSIRGIWNFVTAGHILEEIENGLAQKKIKIVRGFLLDDFGPSPVSNTPIPFDYGNSPKLYKNNEQEGLDFGLIMLDAHYRRLLEANGAVPVIEENWRHQHKLQFDHYFMVGLPSMFLSTQKMKDAIKQKMAITIIPVKPIDTSMAGLSQTKYPRLIAKIADDCPLDDIDGMSGGPILGFSNEKQGLYWVVAVQSSWLRPKRVIFACPIPVIAQFVERLIDADDNVTDDE